MCGGFPSLLGVPGPVGFSAAGPGTSSSSESHSLTTEASTQSTTVNPARPVPIPARSGPSSPQTSWLSCAAGCGGRRVGWRGARERCALRRRHDRDGHRARRAFLRAGWHRPERCHGGPSVLSRMSSPPPSRSLWCPNRATRDPFLAQVRHGVGRLRWAMVAGSVGSSAVVVPDVGREYHTHAPLIEDQHTVGEFGSEGADESFGKTVCLGTTRRNSDHADADIFEYSVERRCELTSSVSDEEPELGDTLAEIHRQVTDLLGGPSAVRVRGRAQEVPRALVPRLPTELTVLRALPRVAIRPPRRFRLNPGVSCPSVWCGRAVLMWCR
jgi:hypothetical protein